MKQRDLELLSSYLDGQLKPSDSARLEVRLSSDPNLRAVLDDLRSARGLLRQLPMRRAPRNFTLTPQMVRRNPPLPRAYPAFKFVTAMAALLLFFTFGANFLVPQMANQSPAFGMGGGGAPEVYSAAPATEAPTATEPPAGLVPLPTQTPPAMEDTASAAATPVLKQAVPQEPPQAQNGLAEREKALQPPVPPVWQIVLAGVALLGILVMLLMRRGAAQRWRK